MGQEHVSEEAEKTDDKNEKGEYKNEKKDFSLICRSDSLHGSHCYAVYRKRGEHHNHLSTGVRHMLWYSFQFHECL